MTRHSVVEWSFNYGIVMPRQLDDQKRDRILAAALEVFGTKGFSVATVKDVADLADVAPGTVYTYFSDKSDLFASVAQSNWDAFHAQMSRILGGPESPQEKALALVNDGMDRLASLHPLLRGMYSESLRHNVLAKNVNRVSSLLADNLIGALPESDPWRSISRDVLLEGFHILIVGMLFDVAMTPPDALDVKIESMKALLADIVRRGA